MNSIFLVAGIWPFSKSDASIRSKIIFHAGTLGLPERQQLGVAELSPRGFGFRLEAAKGSAAVNIAVPLSDIRSLRAYQKKTYSSTFYVVQVEYTDHKGKPCMVAFEIRVFLRRGQALAAAKAWKELYSRLQSQGA